MDNVSYNVIYLDWRAPVDKIEAGDISAQRTNVDQAPSRESLPSDSYAVGRHIDDFHTNHSALRAVFPEVHVCRTVSSCVKTCSDLGKALAAAPTIVIIHTVHDDTRDPAPGDLHRSISPKTVLEPSPPPPEPEDPRGLKLLYEVQTQLRQRAAAATCVFVVALSGHEGTISVPPPSTTDASLPRHTHQPAAPHKELNVTRYLDAGAVDVVAAPFNSDRLLALPSIAYRSAKEAARRASLFGPDAVRKRSWCGVDDGTKPYAYLREAMVSGLMDGICNPDYVDQGVDASTFDIKPQRKSIIEHAVGSWSFSAHDFDEDELIYAVLVMLKHTLQSHDLQQWHMSDERLISFLLATRKVYNSFVLYHNFRHACDVSQALFFFLLKIQVLPRYGTQDAKPSSEKTPLAAILDPFHALTMLIAAIGHDVGHPGVNNLFLVTLNAPLAQLYSDRSVLECFHCAAYTQILRRYWPVAFSDTSMRKFMVNAILATDMGVHAKYIDSLKALHDDLSKRTVGSFDAKTIDENRDLMCCLLIKCADICNAARPIDVATQWARILIDEFANQGEMEKELGIPTCLYGGPPVRGDVAKIAMSQIGFMDMFAIPLFQGISAIFPDLIFGVNELTKNRVIWEQRVGDVQNKQSHQRASLAGLESQPTFASKKELDKTQGTQHHASDPNSALHKDSQMRSAKASSPPATPSQRKMSAVHGMHFNGVPQLPQMSFSNGRRSSLGQTVQAAAQHIGAGAGPRRGSGSHFPGVTSATAIANMRQLDGAQPEIHSPPPSTRAGERGSDAGTVPYLTSAIRPRSTWTEGMLEQQKKAGLVAGEADETGGSSPEPSTVPTMAGPRGKTGRKASGGLSFRFWRRKTGGADSMLSSCSPKKS